MQVCGEVSLKKKKNQVKEGAQFVNEERGEREARWEREMLPLSLLRTAQGHAMVSDWWIVFFEIIGTLIHNLSFSLFLFPISLLN